MSSTAKNPRYEFVIKFKTESEEDVTPVTNKRKALKLKDMLDDGVQYSFLFDKATGERTYLKK